MASQLILHGATSGTVTAIAAATAGSNTATFPALTGTVALLGVTNAGSFDIGTNSLTAGAISGTTLTASGLSTLTGGVVSANGNGVGSNLYYSGGWKYSGNGIGFTFVDIGDKTTLVMGNAVNAGGAGAAATTLYGWRVSTAGAVTLPGHVAGTPTFSAGDKYLVVDASGNIHVSALGPAS